jgi:hypothetical protein
VIGYFLLGLCVLAGLLLLARWFSAADPKVLTRILPRVAILVGAVVLIAIVLTGRVGLLLAFAPMLLLFLARFRALKNRVNAAMGPRPGQTSEVVTRFFRMTLDHDSGGLAGEILDGVFTGRSLDELSREELEALQRETHEDAQSASVLESYLHRRFGRDWHDDNDAGDAQSSGKGGGRRSSGETAGGAMTRQQAYEVLALEPGASEEEIREAHRRLLRKIHPDHGGSNFLAAQINRAKDVLLGH